MTVTVEADLGMLTLPMNNTIYEGYEMHFHTPAEHTIGLKIHFFFINFLFFFFF